MDILILLAVGGSLAYLVVRLMVRRQQDDERWVNYAAKFAKRYGLPLRGDVAIRIARHFRVQHLMGEVLSLPLIYVAIVLLPSPHDPRALVLGTAGIAVLSVVIGVLALLPAWNRTGGTRVAHLTSLKPADLFTRAEGFAIGCGILIGLGGGAVALERMSAGPTLWWAWCAGLVANGACWFVVMRLTLRRRSFASDELELRWDDVLRHRSARGATIGQVGVMAGFAVFMNYELFDTGSLLPLYGIVGAAFATGWFFKRGDGLWRRAWNDSRS